MGMTNGRKMGIVGLLMGSAMRAGIPQGGFVQDPPRVYHRPSGGYIPAGSNRNVEHSTGSMNNREFHMWNNARIERQGNV